MGVSASSQPAGVRRRPAGVWIAVAGVFAAAVAGRAGVPVRAAAQDAARTTRDKVYTKTQAAAMAEPYAKQCAYCHDPSKVPAGKKPGPPVIGDVFLDKWSGKSLGELVTTILTTMPSDMTAVLTEDEAVNYTAYLLQANGFPDGTAALTAAAAKTITIAK